MEISVSYHTTPLLLCIFILYLYVEVRESAMEQKTQNSVQLDSVKTHVKPVDLPGVYRCCVTRCV